MTGEEVSETVEANTREQVVALLKEEGLVVREVTEAGAGEKEIDLSFLGGKKVKEKSLSILCDQLATILESGMPIVRSIELVANQTEDKRLRSILSDTAEDVAAGYSVADSLEKYGEGLPQTMIETVRAGESTGSLDVVFRRLATHYKKLSQTKGKVVSALIYPIFVIVVAIVVVAVIMVVAMPTFKSTYETMGVQLPILTQAMISVSDFLVKFGWLVALVIIAIVVGITLMRSRNEDFRIKWSEMSTHLPVLGRVIVMNGTSQYASTMSMMMSAGLSVVRAVGVTARSIDNYYMAHALSQTQLPLESGRSLTDCVTETEAFPELACAMTGVGEESGALDRTLETIADFYDNEVETATERALSILEPATIVFLGGLVAIIMLAVYLPIFTIETSAGSY